MRFANCLGVEAAPQKADDAPLADGDVVIAAITSCTNTSNPSVLIGAGLVARKARALGLKVKPWVKTSLAPGSQVVTDYLEKAGCRKTWMPWASIWWVTAAPPVSATRDRCPMISGRDPDRGPGVCLGAFRQPQL